MSDAPFEIRRRGSLYAIVAILALVLAGGYGYRAFTDGPVYLWIPVAGFAVLSLVFLRALLDARTPLFVADEHGIRLRTRKQWNGILWAETGEVRIERRHGLFTDAQVKVVSSDGQQIFTTPVGAATTASLGEAEVELAMRRGAPPY